MPNIGIAINKYGAHVIVRAIPKERTYQSLNDEQVQNALNALARTKNARDLLSVVGALPPIVPDNFLSAGRKYSVKEVTNNPKKLELSAPDCELLLTECTLGTDIWETTKEKINSAKLCIRDYSFFEMCLPELVELDSNKNDIYVEPLADWILLRNILAITMQLMSSLSGEDKKPLTTYGFENRYHEQLKDSVWITPFVFNPFFYEFKGTWESALEMFSKYDNYQPFLNSISKVDEATIKKSLLWSKKLYARLLSPAKCIEEDAVLLVTAPVAKEKYNSFWHPKKSAEDKRYWLLTRDNASQTEIAGRIIHGFIWMISNLTVKDKLLGWEYSDEACLDNSFTPMVKINSLPALLLRRAVYHGSDRIVACQQCGSAIIQTNKGPVAVYCSDRCRQAHKRAKDTENE